MTGRIKKHITVVIVVLGILLGGGLLLFLLHGQGISTTLGFVFGWHHIAEQQQHFTQTLTTMVQEAGLPAGSYQLGERLPQRRGQEQWQRQTHTIQLPATLSLGTFAERLQALGEQIRFLSRQEHRDATVAASELFFGKAGVITDIVILLQVPETTQPPASLSLHIPPSTIAPFPKTPLQPASPPPPPAVRPQPVPKASPPQVAKLQPSPIPPAPPAPLTPAPAVPPVPPPPLSGAPGHPQVAIVIDDLGWDFEAARSLLALGVPLSFAILPETPHRVLIAQEARQQRHDVLLHLPMESHGASHIDLGPYGLRSVMTATELASRVEAALEAVPAVIGVNNHMGSRLTEDRPAMHAVMQLLKRHNLFFLDSRTSKDSLAYQVAQELGVRAAQRQVFLDNDADPTKITQQLQRLITVAQQQGRAIGIGHPYPATLKVLQEHVPLLRQAGVQFVTLSRLVK